MKLKAEIAAKQARSINYQMGIARLPLAKELADLDFAGTPINSALVEQLSTGAFLDEQRNVVLIGGTGTGKSHIAIGIARSVIWAGRKARFFNAVDGQGDRSRRSPRVHCRVRSRAPRWCRRGCRCRPRTCRMRWRRSRP